MKKTTKTVPHICPVCEGAGVVIVDDNTVALKKHVCHACKGLGYIFGTETIEEEDNNAAPSVPCPPVDYPYVPWVKPWRTPPYRYDEPYVVPYSPPQIWCHDQTVN